MLNLQYIKKIITVIFFFLILTSQLYQHNNIRSDWLNFIVAGMMYNVFAKCSKNEYAQSMTFQ